MGNHGNETDFGVSTFPSNSEGGYDLYVNVEKQTVSHKDDTWTFEEFILLGEVPEW